MTRSSPKLFALSLAGLALGACTARDAAHAPSGGPRYASLDATLDARPPAGPGAALERAATPVAVLPDWIGRPRRLRERDAPDAFEQVVSLGLAPRGAARENLILLRMPRTPEAASGGTAAGEAGSLTATGGRPSEAGIRAELAATFPDTAMQVVTRPARNAYGSYGLAVGRSPRGARCLYAWQWIAEAPAIDAAGVAGPLALRVRLCRDDVTLEALAAAMNQIKLVPRFTGTPVALAEAARPRARAPRHRSAAREAAVGSHGETRAPWVAPSETMPTAAPGLLPTGRRYLGVADAQASQPEPARNAAPGPAAMRAAFVGAAPTPQAGVIAADLPPEALRGPVPRPSGRP